ncbi:DNA gyrase/topoisomerase IV subunit A [Hominiventricola filiformis]|uniref:DNA topoisomerase (ATP-hydrolyzing) n=1 Tax=Hominiventricola filiformis TaxID=2885352 RepID=A0AAE3A7H2_9FIRM|nr:DNA topoisomerase (ATP-hydrolyzing) [Hominiventricola filiformis]MCC2124620.1 DNA topoisomerase 4 subunit A [Hominiventricola filiformis]RHU85889.1 DNA topoisomerase 4 subunit A [Clostridiaceae bacterium OM08-6BH]
MSEEMIIKTEYSDIMQKSYIDYAMSVIVARALPDVRDGLKPVQRRTLYDMHELGIRSDRPYRKCARIVGDTMGKYHPHGDSSIYEALVVMSQDFKKGLPLIDGHGNFGSIEGDGAAAMRYTEARLQKVSEEALLADLDKDIVDFVPNFDETEKEPGVLPARIPHLLINGAEGIAVGMSTSIPPHNLRETIDAMEAYMKNPELTVEQLLTIMPGPDFPTGGIVVNKDELPEIYRTGAGKIKIRGRVEVEKLKGGKEQLVITEIPYTMIGANIGKFLNDIGSLVESKTTTDIVDITNQSSKEGIRIVLELKKGADTEQLTNMLYKKTRLEDTFGVNMLAVADGRPETLGLKQIFDQVIDFQFELNTRKYKTLLNKELDKKEIQEGLIKACDVIDLIIEILRGSRDLKMAKGCLMSGATEGIRFKSEQSKAQAEKLRFTERQATAILEMRLYKLIGLEIEALMKEHDQTMKNIARYSEILNNYDEMQKVIIADLERYKKSYGEERKTDIVNAQAAVYVEKKIEEMPVVFLMDRFGYCRTVDTATYERNKEAADSESRYVLTCRNTDRLCLFTDTGKMYTAKVQELPYGKFRDKAFPIDNYSNFDSAQERIVCVSSMEDLILGTMLFVTKYGMTKTVSGYEYDVRTRTSMATKLNEGDEVLYAGLVGDHTQLVLQSVEGFFLRFPVEEIPEKKKAAIGVRAMKLSAKDHLEEVYALADGEERNILYKEKEVALQKLKNGSRDQKGTKIRV